MEVYHEDLPLKETIRDLLRDADQSKLCRGQSERRRREFGIRRSKSNAWVWVRDPILSDIRGPLSMAVTGADVEDLDDVIRAMDRAKKGSEFAKSAVEVAVTDLVSRRLEIPIVDYLGGRVRRSHSCL